MKQRGLRTGYSGGCIRGSAASSAGDTAEDPARRGDFRTVIPQTFIEKGWSLASFEENLVNYLSNLVK